MACLRKLDQRLCLLSSPDSLLKDLEKSTHGRFWHWQRSFVLEGEDQKIYTLQLNIFERMILFILAPESFCANFFAKRVRILQESDIKLYMYNATARSADGVRHQLFLDWVAHLEKEADLWKAAGSRVKLGCLRKKGDPEEVDRKVFWGKFSENQYFNPIMLPWEQVIPPDMTGHFSIEVNKAIAYNKQHDPEYPKVALALGCGVSQPLLRLLKEGWKVIWVDNSQLVLDHVKRLLDQEKNLQGRYDFVCEDAESYVKRCMGPSLDLVVAVSSFPYMNPSGMVDLFGNISIALKPGGRLIGSFFGKEYCKGVEETQLRKMGAWLMPGKDLAGYFLGDHLQVTKCVHGGQLHPRSIVFTCQKR